MEKIRTLTWEGMEYQVSNVRGVLGPGKFEGGMALHALRDYAYQDESFGDCDTWGSYWWKVSKGGGGWNDPEAYRYYYENSQGFVYEVSADAYEAEEKAYNAQCAEDSEREDAIREAQDTLAELQAEEQGPCDSCNKMFVSAGPLGSAVIHEAGCPREGRIKKARAHLAGLEDY